MPIKHALEQGTEEWLAFRRKHIGASDAPAIMGQSPWKDIVTLWEEYTGKRQPKVSNYAMERGKRLEPEARDLYNKQTGRAMAPAVLTSSKYPFMLASLDGIDLGFTKAIEIKCPGKESHEMAKQGNVPAHYLPQLYHQMIVAELPSIDYVSYDGESIAIVEVLANEEEFQKIIAEEERFFECVATDTCPVPGYYEIEKLMLDYSDFKDREELIKEKLDKLREEIGKKVEKNIKCCGFSVSWSERKGNVQYDKVPQLSGVNLDQFRGPSSKTLSIRKIGR